MKSKKLGIEFNLLWFPLLPSFTLQFLSFYSFCSDPLFCSKEKRRSVSKKRKVLYSVTWVEGHLNFKVCPVIVRVVDGVDGRDGREGKRSKDVTKMDGEGESSRSLFHFSRSQFPSLLTQAARFNIRFNGLFIHSKEMEFSKSSRESS